MDEKEVNFDMEPVDEIDQLAEEFTCEPCDDDDMPPMEPLKPQYEPTGSFAPMYMTHPEPKKEKQSSKALLIVLLVAVVLIAGLGGVAITKMAKMIRGYDAQRESAMQITEEAVPADTPAVQQPVAEEDKPYEVKPHALPEELAANDTGKSLTLVQVYERTVNSVVGIRTEVTMNVFGQEAVAASAGSGFILSEDGYIITNCHVVERATKVTVDLFNGDSFPAVVVGQDSSFDIAVLKIEAEGLPAVGVGDSDKLKVGEQVVAIGNPLGELTFTMTNGILSALDREINTDGNPQNMLQTDAAINSGNSGGPLFDMDGNVIGVTTAKYSGSTRSGTLIEGLGFAIPINDALKVAYDLVEHGYVTGQAYLGVIVRTLDSQTAAYYGLPVGPRVDSVIPGSCAETAGVQAGDIIIACEGVKVETHPELLAQLKKHKAGETITLTVYRAGAEVELTVILDEKVPEEPVETSATEQQLPEGFQYQFPEGFFD